MEERAPTYPTLVVKGNDFINARHQLTVAEMRIVLTMITQVGRNDEDFKPYRIYIKDFVEAIGTAHKGEYERAREITLNLMKRVMEIPRPKGYLQVSFLSSVEYVTGTGYVELSFDPKLKPYLLQLKERFTQYDIRNVLALQSFYSIRIYELLKQYVKLGERVMEVDELRELLKLPDSYKHYASFKRRIILQAQKDLSRHTDLSFDFEEIKTGRKFTRIRFIIRGNRVATATPRLREALSGSAGPSLPATPLFQRLVEEFGFKERQAEEVLVNYPEAYIEENLAVVVKRLQAGKVKEIVPYTLKALEEDFRKKETPAERVHREKREAVQLEQQQEQVAEAERELLRTQFERERDGLIAQLHVQYPLEKLAGDFTSYLMRENKFAFDFVKRTVVKQGGTFELNEHLDHALIEPIFKQFLGESLLEPHYATFESWLEGKRP